MSSDGVARERLRSIIADRSLLKDGEFTLASGAKSSMFFDMKKTMLDPEGASLLTNALWELLIDRPADCIGGLEMGAVPIVSSSVCEVSLRNLFQLFCPKANKIWYGQKNRWLPAKRKDCDHI